jgi:AraC-like DNA-binding protein
MDLVWLHREVLIAGPQTRYTQRPDRFPLLAIGVRFFPGAAPSLLRLPASDFIDGHVPLASVDARLAGDLSSRVEHAGDLREAFAAFTASLIRRVEEWPAPDPAVSAAAVLLNRPDATVAEVAGDIYVSERHLRRRFTERIGYGPKTFQRVRRFQRLADLLETSPIGLARAAVSAGYADQAHLSRDCRQLAGVTPVQLVEWLERPHRTWSWEQALVAPAGAQTLPRQ